jgi:hypothetical protein
MITVTMTSHILYIWLFVWNMRGHRYHDHMVVCKKYEGSSLPWSYGCLYEIWGVIVTVIIWLSVWNMKGCRYRMTPHISYRQPYDHGNDGPSYFLQTTIWEIWGVIITMIIWLSVWNMRGHRYHDHMVVCKKYEGSSLPWSYDTNNHMIMVTMTPHISYRQPYDHGNDDPSYFIQTTI